ncbi:MAG: hypothetical protein QXS18_05615 [Thermoplasmata archaeon]
MAIIFEDYFTNPNWEERWDIVLSSQISIAVIDEKLKFILENGNIDNISIITPKNIIINPQDYSSIKVDVFGDRTNRVETNKVISCSIMFFKNETPVEIFFNLILKEQSTGIFYNFIIRGFENPEVIRRVEINNIDCNLGIDYGNNIINFYLDNEKVAEYSYEYNEVDKLRFFIIAMSIDGNHLHQYPFTLDVAIDNVIITTQIPEENITPDDLKFFKSNIGNSQGGTITDIEITSDDKLFDDINYTYSGLGKTDYIKIFLKNVSEGKKLYNPMLFINKQTPAESDNIYIAIGSNDDINPEENKIYIDESNLFQFETLLPQHTIPIWIKRVVDKNAKRYINNNFEIKIIGKNVNNNNIEKIFTQTYDIKGNICVKEPIRRVEQYITILAPENLFGEKEGEVYISNKKSEIILWKPQQIEVIIPPGVSSDIEVITDDGEHFYIFDYPIDPSLTHYCEVGNIIQECKHITINSETKITIDEVERWIEEEADIIDTILERIYKTPVKDRRGVEVLKPVNIFRVVARVLRLMDISPARDEKVNWYIEQADAILQKIIDRKIILPDTDFNTKYVPGMEYSGKYDKKGNLRKAIIEREDKW